MSLSSDRALVDSFRSGQDDAFTQIVIRHRPRLVAYARRTVRGSTIDAEDVVQDALINAYSALRGDARPMALRAWLHCIVHNRAVDQLRSTRVAPPFEQATASRSAAEVAVARSEFHDVIAVISRLPDRQRLALLLFVFHGYSYHQIAQELDASLPATKALISRARAGVRPPLTHPA